MSISISTNQHPLYQRNFESLLLLAEVPLALARYWGGWNLQSRETSQLPTPLLSQAFGRGLNPPKTPSAIARHDPFGSMVLCIFTRHALHFALHTLNIALYTPHSALYTPHPKLLQSALLYDPHHFTLHILHPTLYTLHSTFYTWHSTLYTLNSTL